MKVAAMESHLKLARLTKSSRLSQSNPAIILIKIVRVRLTNRKFTLSKNSNKKRPNRKLPKTTKNKCSSVKSIWIVSYLITNNQTSKMTRIKPSPLP